MILFQARTQSKSHKCRRNSRIETYRWEHQNSVKRKYFQTKSDRSSKEYCPLAPNFWGFAYMRLF